MINFIYSIFLRPISRSSHVAFSISEKKLVLLMLFIMLPFFDMLTGYGIENGYLSEGGLASPSQIGRLFVLGFFTYLIVKHRINIRLLYILVPLISIEFLSGLYLQDILGFLTGILSVYKLAYILIIGIVLTFLVKESNDLRDLASFLKINVLLISTSIYFSAFTGLGSSTYGWGFGTKSFFASGNGLGIYLGILCLILIALKQYGLVGRFSGFTALYIAVSIALIGTKTSLFLTLLILLTLLASLNNKRYLFPILLVILFFLIQPIIESLLPIFDVIYSRFQNSDDLGQYVASGRSDYVIDAMSVFFQQDSSLFRLPFGSGSFLSYHVPQSNHEFDTLETDIFDLLFMYGIYGVFIYIMLIFKVCILLKHHYAILLIFLVFIAHSFFAGHVLFNGMSSTVLAIVFVIAKYLCDQKTAMRCF